MMNLLLWHLTISIIIHLVWIQIEMKMDWRLLSSPHELNLLVISKDPLSVCVLQSRLRTKLILILDYCHWISSLEGSKVAWIRLIWCTHNFFTKFSKSLSLYSFWYFILVEYRLRYCILLTVVSWLLLFPVQVKFRSAEHACKWVYAPIVLVLHLELLSIFQILLLIGVIWNISLTLVPWEHWTIKLLYNVHPIAEEIRCIAWSLVLFSDSNDFSGGFWTFVYACAIAFDLAPHSSFVVLSWAQRQRLAISSLPSAMNRLKRLRLLFVFVLHKDF